MGANFRRIRFFMGKVLSPWEIIFFQLAFFFLKNLGYDYSQTFKNDVGVQTARRLKPIVDGTKFKAAAQRELDAGRWWWCEAKQSSDCRGRRGKEKWWRSFRLPCMIKHRSLQRRARMGPKWPQGALEEQRPADGLFLKNPLHFQEDGLNNWH